MKKQYQHIIKALDPSLKMILDKVKRFLSAGKASVMVGCGFSLNAESDGTGKMREWNALNVDLYKSLYGKEPSQSELDRLSPIRLASQVEATHGKKELDEIILNALPDKSVYPGTLHKKLMRLHWKDVFTTNYDTLLERSSEECGSAYTLVTSKETLLYSKSPRIIKLHGSFPNVRPFIMSEEHFRTYPQNYPEFVNTVRQSLIENLFCLIGFSGNDPNFINWLGWIRDVMGEQMTNAVLVEYKKEGIHVSEKQLFASRKIDILNLAEISQIGNYQEALDFFFAYISNKDEEPSWSYPALVQNRLSHDKEKPDYNAKNEKMIRARKTYPGWVYMPERIVNTCGINRFPYLRTQYENLPNGLKLKYLYEIDWLLDMCLYPKNEDWYIKSLEEVRQNYESYNSDDKERARQLIVSLSSTYRELGMLNKYSLSYEYIVKIFPDELTTRQRSVVYYDRCLWYLSKLDYKEVYATLLNWQVEVNDYLGALWQASVYAELGNQKKAEDMLVAFYSRLTSKMLQEDNSAYLIGCRDLYAYVISKSIARAKRDLEFDNSDTIEKLKRILLVDAQKERPRFSSKHGFDIGYVVHSTHIYQGGYVPGYLNPYRYIRLSYLHGNTCFLSGAYNKEEYASVLKAIAGYQLYGAIALTIRSGNKDLVKSVVCRENLSNTKSDDASVIFGELFGLIKGTINDPNERIQTICYDVLLPIVWRLCTRCSDDNLYDHFKFVLGHHDDTRIERNAILGTIYKCASIDQRNRMYEEVMRMPISLDMNHDDIAYPSVHTSIKLTENILADLRTSISDKDKQVEAYARIINLLKCALSDEDKESLQDIIVNWRAEEKENINALYSYQLFPSNDEKDRGIEQEWISRSLKQFLDREFPLDKSSVAITELRDSIGNLVPAISKIEIEQVEQILNKVTKTLSEFYTVLKEDDRDNFMGGFRCHSDEMFSQLKRLFYQIDFSKIKADLKQDISQILLDYLNKHHPCLLHLCLINGKTDIETLAASASNRLFSQKEELRFDAMRSLFYLFKNNPEQFGSGKSFKYIEPLVYYLKYSHSKNIIEYLSFLGTIASERMIDKDNIRPICDSLFEIHNHLSDYDIEYEYKVDIKYYCCRLAGVFAVLVEGANDGISAWKRTSNDPKEFRDVRNGFENGIELVKNAPCER